jgi:hypothetical protein
MKNQCMNGGEHEKKFLKVFNREHHNLSTPFRKALKQLCQLQIQHLSPQNLHSPVMPLKARSTLQISKIRPQSDSRELRGSGLPHSPNAVII